MKIDRFENEYFFLSNFYESDFIWKEKSWKSVEHAYQAAKTTNPLLFDRIRECSTPAAAKKMGRRIDIRKDWEAIKYVIMNELLWIKFSQNEELKKKLIDTGDAELIEGNWWHDNIWGNCCCEDCKSTTGTNFLGKFLMRTRDILRSKLK